MATSGSLIVADYVAYDDQGRYTIVHTFDTVHTTFTVWPPQPMTRRVCLYARFSPERVGLHNVDVVIRNDYSDDLTEDVRFKTQLKVEDPLRHTEIALELQALTFFATSAKKIDDLHYESKATLELQVDGETITTTPIWVKYAYVEQEAEGSTGG